MQSKYWNAPTQKQSKYSLLKGIDNGLSGNKNILAGISKKQLYTGLAIAGVVTAGIVVISLASSPKTSIQLRTGELNKPNTASNTNTNPQVVYVNQNPQNTSNQPNSQDTLKVQAFLYKYYPETVQQTGDIGTYGKPDGVWGANTQKAVDSVIQKYGWTGVAQLIEYAKADTKPWRREVAGMAGIQNSNLSIHDF